MSCYILFTLGIVLPIYVFAYSECDPTQDCINNRVCSFGDTQTYTSVAEALYTATSCQTCINACGNSPCTCPSTGDIQILIKTLEANNSQTGWCTGNQYCKNPLLQQALSFTTKNFPCETGFKIAQQYIIKLCGTVNGECCNGKCEDYMIDIPTPRCDQYKGHGKETRWLFSVYTIITIVLWQWSTNQDVGALLRSQSESIEAVKEASSMNKINNPLLQLGNFL